MNDDPLDPQGLMREAFRIDGITLAECRGLFFDWALSLPDGADTAAAIRTILARYAPTHEAPLQEAEPRPAGAQQDPPQHPMIQVLTDGLQGYRGRVSRRGGWRGRRAQAGPR